VFQWPSRPAANHLAFHAAAKLNLFSNFTDMVMRYLFSLPALVQARKPKPPVE
jgi:hypothetical protein